MPRNKTDQTARTTTGQRIQTRGPMGATVPEVTIHASIREGMVACTPAQYATRMRPCSILVTDDADSIARIPARRMIVVDEAGPRLAMLKAHFEAMALPIEERTIAVAGGDAMVDAALDDAFRVVLSCDAGDDVPIALSTWRTSRPKGSDVTTMTRD